jgi:hypothetical protein
VSSEHSANAALADPNTRTSPLGTAFDAATLLGFIRSGLRHSAVSDEVTRLLYEHVAGGKTTPMQLSEKLRPILEEPLTTATDEDWLLFARDLIADMESVLEVRPLPPLAEGDEELAAMMQRRIHDSTQSADQLRARARELRTQANEFVDIVGIRDACLALADRYDQAAASRRQAQ